MKFLITILLLISKAYAIDCPLPSANSVSKKQFNFIAEPTPILNSGVGYTKVVFIDYDGWNNTVSTHWPIHFYGHSGLTPEQIAFSFWSVAEDYWQNEVWITSDSNIFNNTTTQNKIRIVVTDSSFGGGGGVAWVGSYGNTDNAPAFVFSNRLFHDPEFIDEAISHETGHTVGLWHQSLWVGGILVEAYKQGIGSQHFQPGFPIGWAPIMGDSYHYWNSRWYNGQTNLGPLSFQSDLDTIAKTFPFKQSASNLLLPNETKIYNVQVPTRSIVTVIAKGERNADFQLRFGTLINNYPDSLDARLYLGVLDPGIYPVELTSVDNENSPSVYGSTGQVTFKIIIEPLVIVPNRRDSQYVNRRTERWQYKVEDLHRREVRRGYGELQRATDNLPPGWYIIRFGSYHTIIYKQ